MLNQIYFLFQFERKKKKNLTSAPNEAVHASFGKGTSSREKNNKLSPEVFPMY
jgi:hypothetical protein